MPEVRRAMKGGTPQVRGAEIYIPDDSDLGTGSLTTHLRPRALLSNDVVLSDMHNESRFKIWVNIESSTRQIAVALGQSAPEAFAWFRLPHGIDFRVAHSLAITFAAWKITGASLSGSPLPQEGQ